MLLAFEDVKRIFNALRIEALLDIDAPLRFQGFRGLDLAGEAQEERPGISRQSFEAPDKRVEIERSIDLQERHSRAPVGAGNRDAVDDRLRHARAGPEDRCDLEYRDVLALPAKSVADAIDERVKAVPVATHEVTGSHPRVPRLEDAAEDFLFRLDSFTVALETSSWVFSDASQGLADFAVRAARAKTVLWSKRASAIGSRS